MRATVPQAASAFDSRGRFRQHHQNACGKARRPLGIRGCPRERPLHCHQGPRQTMRARVSPAGGRSRNAVSLPFGEEPLRLHTIVKRAQDSDGTSAAAGAKADKNFGVASIPRAVRRCSAPLRPPASWPCGEVVAAVSLRLHRPCVVGRPQPRGQRCHSRPAGPVSSASTQPRAMHHSVIPAPGHTQNSVSNSRIQRRTQSGVALCHPSLSSFLSWRTLLASLLPGHHCVKSKFVLTFASRWCP